MSVQTEFEVTGKDWTTEGLIAAALVKRLGGTATISPDELCDIKGMEIRMTESGEVR